MFRLAAELESHAAGLHLEALQHLTIALAGVDCRELFTLLVTFFGRGSEFQEDPFNYLDGTPKSDPLLTLLIQIRMTRFQQWGRRLSLHLKYP